MLVTGHTGFKGRWCVAWLQKSGAVVGGLALAPRQEERTLSAGVPDNSSMAEADIRDPAAVATVFERFKPEVVFHLAAQALVLPSYEDPVGTFDTNVMGLIHVLEAARRTPSVRAFVNVTSDKCYDNKEQIWPYREIDSLGGKDPYSASKACAEIITSAFRSSFFSDAATVSLASGRAGNVIGGGDVARHRLLPDCVAAFRAQEPAVIRNPDAVRPWQHVLEPLSGYFALAERLLQGDAAVAEAWNFGPSEDGFWTAADLAKRAAELWGEGAEVTLAPSTGKLEARFLRVDSSKARSQLGWAPLLSVAEAVDWTIDWWRRVGRGEDAYSVTLDQIERYEALRAAR